MSAGRSIAVSALVSLALLSPGISGAQSFRRGGVEFNALREVSVSAGKSYTIVVTEFFHHGEIASNGRNLLVSARNQQLVPSRILQLGPGDFCRVAFQTIPGQSAYEILYGGDAPAADVVPPWTNEKDGLLLETRHFQRCNLNSLDSVRDAFKSSAPFGADYVDAVQHSHNPFSLAQGPFLSRYSGYLHVSAGTYGFMTSSRDCSFLLIDGKPVTSAPGRHPAQRRAVRGLRSDVKLSGGAHKFEYYHAAGGADAMMVLAWELSPKDPKPQPSAIPPDAFHAASVGHLPAEPVTLKNAKLVPDFLVKIESDVPLPDNDLPLISVVFKDISPKSLTGKAKVQWDFGDGQTSEQLDARHVYLRPGLYTVKLEVSRAPKSVETVNRVYVDRPVVTRNDKTYRLEDYLPLVSKYDPRTLDAVSLRQLVLVYEAKAMSLEAPSEEKPAEEPKPPPRRQKKGGEPKAAEPPKADQTNGLAALRRADATKFITRAVDAGKVAFLEQTAARGDDDLYKLARLIGPSARDRLGQSQLAFEIWQGAAQKITRGGLKAECEIEAADVALNDLVKADAAKPLLTAATTHLGRGKTGAVASALQRTWGDHYAATGNGEAARKAYRDAESMLASNRNYVERAAWRGAYNRSTEDYLRAGELDRAAAEIRSWARDFPGEKIDGHLTLLWARYWSSRQKYPQAIALCEQLLAVNRDSPYMDQLLLLAAECEVKRGRTDRALATLHSLLKDYPGSPLVPAARKYITQLEGAAKPPKKLRTEDRAADK